MELSSALANAQAKDSSVANNYYIEYLVERFKFLDSFVALNPGCKITQGFHKTIIERLHAPNCLTTPTIVNAITQTAGEFELYAICKNLNINIEKIKEGLSKTPDFLIKLEKNDINFECKTFSVSNPDHTFNKQFHDSMKSKIELSASTKSVDFREIIMSPFADKCNYNDPPDKDGDGWCMGQVNVIQEKLRQNFKKDQFPPTTFLVLNLAILDCTLLDWGNLLPVRQFDGKIAPGSGPLWMLAFGKTGMIVFDAIDDYTRGIWRSLSEKDTGVLENSEYSPIKGLVIMGRRGELALLAKSEVIDMLQEDRDNDLTQKLFLNIWNDELDRNGNYLREKLLRR